MNTSTNDAQLQAMFVEELAEQLEVLLINMEDMMRRLYETEAEADSSWEARAMASARETLAWAQEGRLPCWHTVN